MNELKGHWDHSTKPSQFCVKRGKEEIYRGGYNQGYEILMNSKTPETNDLARGNHVVPTEWAEQLERERDEAREYADKLAEGLPDGMLPKDVEVLREANLGLATELATVTAQRDRLAEALRKVSRSWNYVEVAQQALQSLTLKP